MKKLIWILIIWIFYGCYDGDLKHPIKSEGTVIMIKKEITDSTAFILVRFQRAHIANSALSYDLWIQGSDTCYVGQKVKLQ